MRELLVDLLAGPVGLGGSLGLDLDHDNKSQPTNLQLFTPVSLQSTS